jgi:hypothetical protein
MEQPRKPIYREHSSLENVAPAQTAPKPPDKSGSLLDQMARDLAQRLSVRPSELQVLAVESVTWNDGSLGCPQPGQAYTQALVPGLRVLFQHAGKTYQYHAAEKGSFVYCPNPSERAGHFDEK